MPTTHYIWDELNDSLLKESDETGAPQALYTNEPVPYGSLISQRRGNGTSYYHFDGQHSTRQLSDARENVTDTYTYLAFGETLANSGTTLNPFGYKGSLGYYVSPETDDFYVRARPYQARIARWLSRDPSVVIDNVTGYTYCFNRPLDLVDPSGHSIVPIW